MSLHLLHNYEAEQSVVGGLLIDPKAFDRIGNLAASDFYHAKHAIIFETIAGMLAGAKSVDTVTVAESLERRNLLEQAGGLIYLSDLAGNTPGTANIKRYAEIVKERAVKRQLMDFAADVSDLAQSGHPIEKILNAIEQQLVGLAAGQEQGKGIISLGEAMKKVILDVEQKQLNGGGVTGVPTGFMELDNMTTGLHGGELILIAGRPSMGKTAFGLNIAEHVAVNERRPVLVFSLEMPDMQLAARTMASLGEVSMQSIRSGDLTDKDWDGLGKAVMKGHEAPLYLCDDAMINLHKIRAHARRMQRERGLALIVVDYLQLMEGEGDNRTEEVGRISRGLKLIAKEFNVPVIALSQLSRKCEERGDKRPLPSDLRDSGAIEQDSDTIMFVYRDEVYHPGSKAKGTAEILVRKQRNGPIGNVRLWYRGAYTRFENYDGEPIEEDKPEEAMRKSNGFRG